MSVKLFGLLVCCSSISFSALALPTNIMANDGKIDVGAALILDAHHTKVCESEFANPQQAYQCKSYCGLLGDKLSNIVAQTMRGMALQQLRPAYKQFAQFTMACQQIWQGRQAPTSFGPFVHVFKQIQKNVLPAPGTLNFSAPMSSAQIIAELRTTASQLRGWDALCSKTVVGGCDQSCAIFTDIDVITDVAGRIELSELNGLNAMNTDLQRLAGAAHNISQKGSRCAQHTGRNWPWAFLMTKAIADALTEQTSLIASREQEAKRAAKQQELARRQAEKDAQQLAQQKVLEAENARLNLCRGDSPFIGMPGCSYLTALYDNDFEKASQIDYQWTLPFREGWMGKSQASMWKMFSPLMGEQGQAVKDELSQIWQHFSFINKLLGTYATYYEAHYPHCVGSDAAVITLTSQLQKEYRDGFGYLVRTENFATNIDTVRIPPRLIAFLDLKQLHKEVQKSEQLLDMFMGSVNRFPRIDLVEVTKGLSTSMQRYACDSNEIRTLESQMIKYKLHRIQTGQIAMHDSASR